MDIILNPSDITYLNVIEKATRLILKNIKS